MSGTQISDMTDSLTVFPDGAFVPMIVTTDTSGLVTTENYRYNAGLYLAKLSTLAGVGGAALIGSTGPSTVQADLNARPTSAALALGTGAALIGHTGNVTGEVLQTQSAIDNQLPLSFERFGGGPSASAATNNAAWVLMMAAIDAGSAGVIQLYVGTYSISSALLAATFYRNITIQGMGPARSIIRQTTANANGITFPNGLNNTVTIRDLTIQGAGSSTSFSGTGIGIFQPYNGGANDSFNIHVENVFITNFGSHAVELLDTFTTSFNRVEINYCGGYGFIAGGNTGLMESCYVHNLASAQVAYRIFDGNWSMIACNGVDTGDYWGRFGRSTLEANDLTALGANADAFPFLSLDACNIEAYAVRGLDLWNGVMDIGPNVASTSKTNTANVIGVRTRSSVGRGFMGSQPALGAGSSWANSLGVHTASGYAPSSFVLGLEDTASLSYYDELNSIARTMPYDSMTQVSLGTMGKLWSHTRVTGSLGFATGAGGTVTQATNKSTTVVLNTSTGEITMNNAALNAGVIVSFTLTNSTIVASDHVLVQHISGGTVGSYSVTAGAGSGSATIYVRNNTAGNLSEAIVLKFSVLKAVTS